MANPQQPELRRSEENLRPRPDQGPDPHDVEGRTGPIPPDNQPGHHPEHEQDKPPADKFAAALGIKPDTEVGSETPPPSERRSTSDEDADDADASADEPGEDPADEAEDELVDAVAFATAVPSDADQAEPAADTSDPETAETSVPSSVRPLATAAATTFGAGSGGTRAEPSPFPGPDAGGAAATSAMVAAAPAPSETAEQAAVLHHHALPDKQLPHDTGFVTPAGTPVTGRTLLWPLQLWGASLKMTGDAVCAYGNLLRKIGQRIAPDQD